MNARITPVGHDDILQALVSVETLIDADTANMIRAYIASLEASCDHVMGLLERANAQIAALKAKLKACELGSDNADIL